MVPGRCCILTGIFVVWLTRSQKSFKQHEIASLWQRLDEFSRLKQDGANEPGKASGILHWFCSLMRSLIRLPLTSLVNLMP